MNHVIIAISGKQGSGKTTLAKSLYKWAFEKTVNTYHWKFADPLYDMEKAISGVLGNYGRSFKRPDGRLLQLLGTEWGREVLGQNIWADILEERIRDAAYAVTECCIIIDDARFPNEFALLQKLKSEFRQTFTVRLEASEETRKVRAEKWRDRTNHPSEVGLDHLTGLFDAVIDADKYNAEEVLLLVTSRLEKLIEDK